MNETPRTDAAWSCFSGCTEPNRDACRRLCSDFCNAKEELERPLDAATCSRSFWIQVREVTSVLGRRKTFFRALDTASGELITTGNTRRCAESVAVELYGYAPISSENAEVRHGAKDADLD